jgi:hypothetical protein
MSQRDGASREAVSCGGAKSSPPTSIPARKAATGAKPVCSLNGLAGPASNPSAPESGVSDYEFSS